MSSPFFDDPRMLAPRQTVKTLRPGGGFELASPEPLQPYARCVGEWLEHWAQQTPAATAFAEPAPEGGWRSLSWGALRAQVGAVAQGLLDLQLPAGKPIAILSDNSLDHLVLVPGRRSAAASRPGCPGRAVSRRGRCATSCWVCRWWMALARC